MYRARDTKLDRDVALKILPASFASDPDRLMRFTLEARTLGSLNHPGIAQVNAVEDRAPLDDAQGAMAFEDAVAVARQMVTIQVTDPLLGGIRSLVFYLAIAAITMRFGLVMLFSYMHFSMFESLFIAGFTVPAFATSSLVIGLVAALAPAVFGFYTATRGRRASGWLDA